jgi:hypothetical protein
VYVSGVIPLFDSELPFKDFPSFSQASFRMSGETRKVLPAEVYPSSHLEVVQGQTDQMTMNFGRENDSERQILILGAQRGNFRIAAGGEQRALEV